MRLIGNLIWVLFGGLLAALAWFVVGLVLCATIIGIPFGLQFFKFSRFVLWPFGSDVVSDFGKHSIMNIIWIIIGGWETFILYIGVGVFYCMTIIGIPFGLQWFKLAILALFPFGAKIK